MDTEKKVPSEQTSPSVDGATAEYLDSQMTSVIDLAGPFGIPGKDSSQS